MGTVQLLDSGFQSGVAELLDAAISHQDISLAPMNFPGPVHGCIAGEVEDGFRVGHEISIAG